MKITKKLVATVSCAALAFSLVGLVGCSSDSTTNTPTEITTADINAQDIEVTNVGYTILDDGTMSYAFTVNNPNDGYIADGVTFTIEAYDADDMMVVGGGETIHEIYPNLETAAAGTAFLAGSSAIERFEVKPLMEHVRWTKTNANAEEIASMFNVSNVEVTDIDGQTNISGTISCDLGSNDPATSSSAASTSMVDRRESAQITVLFLDADGNILCGAESSSIMLDASMTATSGVPTTLDEEGNPVDTEDTAVDEYASDTTASTTFTVSIPGTFSYNTYRVVVAPGI